MYTGDKIWRVLNICLLGKRKKRVSQFLGMMHRTELKPSYLIIQTWTGPLMERRLLVSLPQNGQEGDNVSLKPVFSIGHDKNCFILYCSGMGGVLPTLSYFLQSSSSFSLVSTYTRSGFCFFLWFLCWWFGHFLIVARGRDRQSKFSIAQFIFYSFLALNHHWLISSK